MVRQRNIWFSLWCSWNFKSSEMLQDVDRSFQESQGLWKRRFLFNCRYGVTSQKTCNLMLWYLIAGLKPQNPRHFERQYSGRVSPTLRPPTSATWLQNTRIYAQVPLTLLICDVSLTLTLPGPEAGGDFVESILHTRTKFESHFEISLF